MDWISVKNKLPKTKKDVYGLGESVSETSDDVLVYVTETFKPYDETESLEAQTARYIQIGRYYKCEDGEFWLLDDDLCSEFEIKVTYWLPLPEKPKEE